MPPAFLYASARPLLMHASIATVDTPADALTPRWRPTARRNRLEARNRRGAAGGRLNAASGYCLRPR